MVFRVPTGSMKSAITLAEGPAGTPRAVTSWFPEKESTGRAFIY